MDGTRSRASALALAAALLLAGCGDGGREASSDAGGSVETEDRGADLGYGAPPAAGGDTDATEGATDESASDDGAEAAAEEVVIVIQDFTYALPDPVPPGAEIVVRNEDGVGHTVTADDGESFDVAVGPGEEVVLTAPSEAGDYPFHCTPHPAMTGTLVVEGDGS